MFQIELYTKILTELEVQKTIDLLLEGQNWFFVKRDVGQTNEQQRHFNE